MLKFAGVAVIATCVVICRVWWNRSVRVSDDDDDRNGFAFINDGDGDVIDPTCRGFAFPQLVPAGLRQNLVMADVNTWTGNCAEWQDFSRL